MTWGTKANLVGFLLVNRLQCQYSFPNEPFIEMEDLDTKCCHRPTDDCNDNNACFISQYDSIDQPSLAYVPTATDMPPGDTADKI
jgi:hypothetical protein